MNEKDEAVRRILMGIFSDEKKGSTRQQATPLPDAPFFTEADVERIVRRVLDSIADEEVRKNAIT